MKTSLLLVALLGITGVTPAYAQQATEQFIPLGSSPGLSATKTRIGIIESFEPGSAVITLSSGAGRSVAEITTQTRIWLDRSRLNLSNLSGNPSDLQPGRRCEIRFLQADSRKAEWIKVEVSRP
jgi:hypothetical protein